MGIIKEFKEFAVKGNMIDMAVGIILGGAFGAMVTSLVNHIMMPPLGMLVGGVDFADKKLKLGETTKDGAKIESFLSWGTFVNTLINFIIVAFALFLVIKAINTLKRKEAAAPPPPPPGPTREEILLTEIRDALRAQKR